MKPFFDVRMKGFRDRTELTEAWELLNSRVKALAAETISLGDAAGRVLASPIVSEVAVPPFDRAAMDGFAVRAEETFGAGSYNPLELTVIGEALPGRPFTGTVHSGQAVRIMTGAPLPPGANAVLQAESAEESGSIIRIHEPVPPLRHVGRNGEDISPGQNVLNAGRVLRPQDLGILASIGASSIPVYRQPRVRILVTGDELLPCGSKPAGHRIVDSNSIMLAALVRRDSGLVHSTLLLPDQRDLIRQAMLEPSFDLLLACGGTSVGQEDHVPGLLAELGELTFHGLALRPASPAGIGFLDGRPVFLLPGNPVSCLCAYDLFAGRAIRQLGARSPELPYRVRRLPLAGKIVSAVGRVDYVRVCIQNNQVVPLAVSGASLLSTTVVSDGFVLVDRDREGHAPGEEVDVFLYDS
jgi:molybdopterin molybdotransferase